MPSEFTRSEAEALVAGDPKARSAASAILDIVFGDREKLFTGGCNPFMTPTAWWFRDEDFGNDAGCVLVVLHDGGDLAGFFNWSYGEYDRIDAVAGALRSQGLIVEQVTSWCSIVRRDGCLVAAA